MEHDRALPGDWVSPSRRHTIQTRPCPPCTNPLRTTNRYAILDQLPGDIALQYTPERSPRTALLQHEYKLNARTNAQHHRQRLYEASIAASINAAPTLPIDYPMATQSPVAIQSPHLLPPISPDIGPSLALSLPYLQPLQFGVPTLASPPLAAPEFIVPPLAAPNPWRSQIANVAMNLIAHLQTATAGAVTHHLQALEQGEAILNPPPPPIQLPSARILAQR
jgi:hypothetical protein